MDPEKRREWHQEQIKVYAAEEYAIYEGYTAALQAVLFHAARLHAPLAIVQARPKAVSSFAEKALRRKDWYDDPAHELTDLCGGRVITNTQSEADAVCEFVRERFRIVEEENLGSRLAEAEFGYDSTHFLVRLSEPTFDGVSLKKIGRTPEQIREEVGERVAEIQVRTLLQHAWADINHDRLYKSPITVPPTIRRTAHRLAAILEDAGGEFDALAARVDAYVDHYDAYLSADQLEEEIQTLDLILENEPVEKNRPKIALRLACAARALHEFEIVADRLGEFEKEEGPLGPAIRLELGRAHCRRNRPDSPAFAQGLALLDGVARADEVDLDSAHLERDALRAEALALSARYREQLRDVGSDVLDRYRKANALDPTNPYHLADLLLHEAGESRNLRFARITRPQLVAAIDTCREHARVGIQLPAAYLAEARFRFFLGQDLESLSALACAAIVCDRPGDLRDELESLGRLARRLDPKPESLEWLLRTLALAVRAKGGEPGPQAAEFIGEPKRTEFRKPVLIVAGSAGGLTGGRLEMYRTFLGEALDGFDGTILSGGTTAGVPGIVGDLSQRGRLGRETQTVGYVPGSIPVGDQLHGGYSEPPVASASTGYSPLEPEQMWIDLLSAGIDPSEVRLLGIGGRTNSAFEYRLALALGARAGIIERSGAAADELLTEVDFWPRGRLLPLPEDRMSVRFFAVDPVRSFGDERLEEAAQAVHDAYVEDNKASCTDPSFLPWLHVPEDFKNSNRAQARACEWILRSRGYRVVEGEPPERVGEFADRDIEAMAEMEHGRWVAERLNAGWIHAKKKDKAKKRSPYLVGWNDLEEKIRDYDRRAVRAWPEVLARAGLSIVKGE